MCSLIGSVSSPEHKRGWSAHAIVTVRVKPMTRETNTPDVLTADVADMAVGLLLAAAGKIPQADRFVREGKWADGASDHRQVVIPPST